MKFPLRILLFSLLFFGLFAVPAIAQTIAVSSNFDTTLPYSPGSSIAVPFHVDDATGCIAQTNSFNLYLSDASGVFSTTPLTTVTDYYGTFINATIPLTTPAGTGYKVKITSTSNPAATIVASTAFTINAGAIITPAIDGAAVAPGVFGVCESHGTLNFGYTNLSTGATSGSVAFFNELTQTLEATNPTLSGTFNANQANYTVIVKGTDGTSYGTKAYSLLNNVASNSITASGSNSACLSSGAGGSAVLTYNVPVSVLKNNFPGNTYKVTWGDGSSPQIYTYCDIKNASGTISHTYTKSSCGNVTSNGDNVFEIDVQPVNPYCGSVGTLVSTYAKVTVSPSNSFSGPVQNGVLVACTNTAVSFNNTSYPGQDPTSGSCINGKARYTWYVDGIPVKFNALLSDHFVMTFPTAGNYAIKLELQTGTSECGAVVYQKNICIQDSPTPSFTVPASICLSGPSTTVTPVNTFAVDNTCFTNPYQWVVTGGTVTYAGGTNASSVNPQFVFTTPGVYLVNLTVTDACGVAKTAPQQKIIVNTAPTVTLSANTTICNPQTLIFSTANNITKTTYGGTSDPASATYHWTVTSAGGIAPATFAGGTSAASQYPQINFPDFGDYTVTVTHTNICGTSSPATQVITVKTAPTITANALPLTVCEGTSTQLAGSVSGTFNSFQWIGGSGTFTPSRTDLNPTYTPTHAEFLAGSVTLRLQANTSLPAPCNTPNTPVTLTLVPTDRITSAANLTICSGNSPNYTITASNSGSSFTWVASGPATITGFNSQPAPQSGTVKITDALVNTDPNNDGIVTYTITPVSNGCTGTPFTYTVTVTPTPVLTPIADASICSGGPTNIVLSATPAGTKYKWTVAAPAGISGASPQSAPATGPIGQTLTNNTNAPIIVTYTITPQNSNGCPGAPVTAKVTVNPLTTIANAGNTAVLCNAAGYTLAGNTPLVGTGKWTEQNNLPVTFANNTSPTTAVTGLVPGTTYHFTWTITSTCGVPSASTVTVTDNLPSAGGIAATSVSPVCFNSNGSITLSGNVGNVVRWERSVDAGTNWLIIPGINTATTYNYTNLIQTTAFRAVVINGNCNFSNSQPVTVLVNAATVIADAGTAQELCTQANAVLHGNAPGASTGTWTQQSGPIVNIATPGSPTTSITGLTGGQTYVFRWTIKGLAPCPDSFSDVTITDQGPITNTVDITGNNSITVCANTNINLSGSLPTGGNNSTYTYLWERSIDNGLTWAAITNANGQNAITSVTVNTLFRRTVFSGPCNSVSNQLSVITQSALGNNSIATNTTETCYFTAPATPIIGSLPTGGDGLYFYRWQLSIDGVNFTDIVGAGSKDYQPPALTVTSYYRRIVSTTLCSGSLDNTSNVVSVKVNADVVAKFTATMQTNCAPFIITSQIITANADPNAQGYSWYANGQLIGSQLAFPGYTIPTDGVTVTIMLRVTNKFGCKDDTYTLDFNTIKQVTAGFTMDQNTGCGPLTVNFTNTSNPLAGANYTWVFGDGSANYTGVTPPSHTFQPSADGKDVTYTVTLIPTGCSPTPFSLPVTVYPAKPVAAIDPGTLTGCSPYIIKLSNLSPGTNSNYTYYLLDEHGNLAQQPVLKTDKSDVQFAPVFTTTTKIYTVYMVAKNLCGITNESTHYPITISASGISALMSVTPVNSVGVAAGCAPFQAVFHNLSTGGNNWVYNIYDSNFVPIANLSNTTTNDQNYSFPTPGTYYVSIGVFSACSAGLESPKTKIVVYPVPVPDFTADNISGCTQLTVKFTNNTPGDGINAPASSFTYDWDFGDGTHSSDFQPTHTYSYTASPYTVKLTATNNNGCPVTVVKTDLIIVHPPPGTNFTARPDTITSIPNYTFAFEDKSTGKPISWKWYFGDGTTSSLQTPSHTYADTGKYVVKLVTFAKFGCTDSITHTVRITGVPGQLYIPNAFMPTSLTNELRTFTVKGSGIKQWTMRIFNNWGQMVFETSKLSSKGEPVEFWDGTVKGQPAQQGVYAWEVSATFINGTTWKGMSYKDGPPKKAGTLNLIR